MLGDEFNFVFKCNFNSLPVVRKKYIDNYFTTNLSMLNSQSESIKQLSKMSK